MKKGIIAAIGICLALAGAGVASADDITADVITYNGKTKVVSASGNVVIHANQGATITGKSGEYRFEDRSAYLEGGVHYVKEQMTMSHIIRTPGMAIFRGTAMYPLRMA